MADTITTKNVLQNVFDFADGDTRTLNLNKPHDSLTAADVQAWADYGVAHEILIGDKAGAKLTGIKSSKKIEGVSTKLDVS